MQLVLAHLTAYLGSHDRVTVGAEAASTAPRRFASGALTLSKVAPYVPGVLAVLYGVLRTRGPHQEWQDPCVRAGTASRGRCASPAPLSASQTTSPTIRQVAAQSPQDAHNLCDQDSNDEARVRKGCHVPAISVLYLRAALVSRGKVEG